MSIWDKVANWRKEFPALQQKVYGQPLVYLDSAASSLKPRAVIDRQREFYEKETANVHRGAHFLGAQGTANYEAARETTQKFLNARSAGEIVFTRGTTEGINLVAQTFAERYLRPDDEILLTDLEHHSNIVPWQIAAQKVGAKIKVVPLDASGILDRKEFQKLLSKKTKMLAITGMSNVLGVAPPLQEMIAQAHLCGAQVLVDAAQLAVHEPIDVQKLGCDYLVLSGHKIYAPFGIGVLYGRAEWLEELPPYQAGGSMIEEVRFEKTTFLHPPQRFEAGTPNVGGAIALAEALKFVSSLGWDALNTQHQQILNYARESLAAVEGLRIFAAGKQQAPILSFEIEGLHASDLAEILDRQGIAIRAGHLCAQPLMRRLAVSGVARASFSLFNDRSDVDALCAGLQKAKEFLR